MKNELFKKWFVAALYVLALGSTAARAEPDSFGLGSGRNGPKTVSTLDVINSYAQVTGNLAQGATTIPVGGCVGAPSCFAAGDLVMVLQTTGLTPAPGSGDTNSIDLSNSQVGRWEFARLQSVSGSTMTLTAPLRSGYATHVTQVIRVPEYTSVTIAGGGTITARSWDGSMGGVIAFLATGTVSNAGEINASGTGFRGGASMADATGASNCSSLDQVSPSGARKGEGIVSGAYGFSWSGRGNVANGAGGGICYNSGGGGGGNGGAGGDGGRSDASDGSRPVGGLGGAALVYSMLDHLTLGGGGGAGHGSAGTGGAGGSGGGIIFIRAHQLTGTGFIRASGGSGSTSSSDGASGGGAGGSIYLRFVSTAACGAVSAYGGVGGSVNDFLVGPGGGGGGGRVLFQAAAGGSCYVSAFGGIAGSQQDSSENSYGAVGGSGHSIETLPGGFVVPPVPTVITPTDGSSIDSSHPSIMGMARPNTTVLIFIDGVEVDRVISNAAGNYGYTTAMGLSNGTHGVQAATEFHAVRSLKTATSTFTVDSTAPAAPVITTPANGALLSNSLPFIAGVTEPYSTITLLIDGVVHGTVPSNMMGHWSYTPQTNLADGPHAVGAVAVDNAGNVSPAATSTFSLDTLAPDTTIVVRPPSVSNSTSATFEFHSAEAGVMFLCRLDGGAFAFCSNPMTFTSLSATVHSLEVRAMDMAGNEDATPDSYSWRVDPGAGIDADADGLPDSIEMASSTNPADDDSDDDGILDGNEDTNRNGVVDPGEANPRAVDTDGDGLQDGLEMGLTSPQGQNTNIAIFMLDADPTTRTSPFQADTDGDGIPDGIEDSNHNGRHDPGELDPLDSTDGTDTDGDGLDNDTESRLGLDPFDGDCDDDGVLDGVEGLIDSDGDGRIDALDPDSDDDGVFDGTERGVTLATAPVWTDTRSPHFHLDADPATTTDPRRADTDGDGLLDGDEDHDANGFFDARSEMDPNDPDTDHDGVSDGVEAQQGTGTDGQTPQRGGCSATGSSLGGTLAVLLLGPSLRRRRHPRNR